MATDRLVLEDDHDSLHVKDNLHIGNIDLPLRTSLEERYLEVMRKLQFGKYYRECFYYCKLKFIYARHPLGINSQVLEVIKY